MQLAVADDATVERWDRTICLHTERKTTDGQPAVASGFIVEHKKSLWLVSAVHVAQDTNARTRIVYRTKSGESRWVHLGGLAETETNPWSDYENSHVASREMMTSATWGNEKIFYAIPSVASGTSGGPVYESIDDACDVAVVGRYIGFECVAMPKCCRSPIEFTGVISTGG